MADIICIQGTKLGGDFKQNLLSNYGGRWIKFACLEVSGTRGGGGGELRFLEEDPARVVGRYRNSFRRQNSN